MTLDELGLKYGTDKSSIKHNFCNVYDKFFTSLRDTNLNFLEIGVLNGSSTKMWREYFSSGNIIGIDIDSDCKRFEDIEKKLFIEIGRQEDHLFINSVIEKYNHINIVLDDGSHFSDDQINTFELIFPKLAPRGFYIIEDLHCGYDVNYGGHGAKGAVNPNQKAQQNIILYLKSLIDNINCDGDNGAYQERLSKIGNSNINFKSSMIKSMSFYTSTCIIEKF